MSQTKREKRSAEVYELNPQDLVFEEGFNCRQQYNNIEGLANSIKTNGQANPVQVYKARSGEHKGKYLVRVGHRRTLATQMISESDPNFTIKAIKLKSDDPKANLILQGTSQTEEPLNSIEMGILILRLKKEHGMNNTSIENSLGISSATLNNYASQARMPESVQMAISNGEISGGVVNTFLREVRETLSTERADNFSPQVLSAVEGKVQRAVSSAKEKGTKGNKAKTVTGADVAKKQSLIAKVKQLKTLVESEENASEVLKNFVNVVGSLNVKTVEEVFEAFS